MGNTDSKLNFRKAVIQLTTKTQPVEATDDAFWDQFWADPTTTVQDVFALVPAAEIRAVREESPSNLATLCYKAVEKLVQGAESGCPSEREKTVVLNCCRMLARILPYIFEDQDWRGFFWSTVPGAGRAGMDEVDDDEDDEGARPLAESLLLAIADLLFCPDFTVQSHKRNGPDSVEDMHSLDSCEYIWEAGVGFAQSPPLNYIHDLNRTELLRLLLTCFSEAMYLPPSSDNNILNPWVTFFCSTENRHALPLFTSLLNVVCAYDPVGYGIPYNHLLFADYREALVEQALQILITTLEHEGGSGAHRAPSPHGIDEQEPSGPDNLFVNYLSRIHREEDYDFVLKGLARLLSNPLAQTYLPNSSKKIQFHQELLVLFWKLCDFNKKFLYFVLKSSDVLDVLVPILFYLNDARADQSRVGLMHIGVFILLLLSGERNFGVRLNKPYSLNVTMDIPVFTGTHADMLIIVFHKIITSGHQRLQPLFDCLLTIIVNVSPYLKSLSMVSANKLLHLLEAFSTHWYLFSASQNHHLVFFLLEAFNNIIQYQFDGNCNLVYAIIRKRSVFHQLANLPTDAATIQRALQRKKQKPDTHAISRTSSQETVSMEGSRPAVPAEPGTLKASLVAIPGIDKLTEKSQVGEDGTMVALPRMDSPKDREVEPSTSAGASDTESNSGRDNEDVFYTEAEMERRRLSSTSSCSYWNPTPEWALSWKSKLPLQTIMRLLQVLVPQVEKICIDKGLTDESEILKFLQHGTLVGLLPVPHPILIRKYQANAGTAMWFRTYMWGVVYLRNVDPPIWYDTDVRLFEIQRM
ncbi:protein HID1 [Engraulis encrasicolus]|uniref:protein HID1 n=1 Tax=Engraulis encrasicolus TaxID=184585 RepID=UPI002FD04AF7